MHRKKSFFSLVELLIVLGLVALIVAGSASLWPSFENYRFRQNQKKIVEALRFAYFTAQTQQIDVLVVFENKKHGLNLRLFSDEKGVIFFKDKQKSFLKNFSMENPFPQKIRFSATGWIFPKQCELHFKRDAKEVFFIDLEKMFCINMDQKIAK